MGRLPKIDLRLFGFLNFPLGFSAARQYTPCARRIDWENGLGCTAGSDLIHWRSFSSYWPLSTWPIPHETAIILR